MLDLSPDEMRRLGYRAVDAVVDHYAAIGDSRALTTDSRESLEAAFREPIPRRPSEPDAVVARVVADVFGAIANVGHPRFFGYVPGPSNFVGVIADLLASGFNPFSGNWSVASGPAQIELVTIDWLRSACGMPESAGGLFVSGGSVANLMAIVAAREQRFTAHDPRATIYCSDQTHASVRKASRTLGFAEERLRVIPTERQRMDVDALRLAIARDRAAGLEPLMVVANAGTTNTGAVDPIEEIADTCHDRSLWLHVDGAYGAAASLSPSARGQLAGIGRADSLTLDPHKWLFQPFECGCLLVRDREALPHAFASTAEYMREAEGAPEEVNFRNYGLQLTRQFRALKLWMSLQVFGADAFARAIDHGIACAEYAERHLRESTRWEVVTPASLAVVTFRRRDADDGAQRRIARSVNAGGDAMVITTVVDSRSVLRLCTINPRTTEADIDRTLRLLDEAS